MGAGLGRRWKQIGILWVTAALVLISSRGFGICVTDQLGRQITVTDDVKRVIALAPSITEIVFALGQDHRLVGVTQFSNYPDEVAKFPRVGSYVHLDLEKIVALKPDLCIAIKDGNPREIAFRLQAMNIPVYAVDPRDLKTVMNTISEIGDLLDARENARILVRKMQTRIGKVKAMVEKSQHRPGVFFQIGISPIVSVGTHTFTHELISIAGGTNLSEGPVPYPRFSKEQVIALSPEVLIITSMARERGFDEILSQWTCWPDLPAVKYQRISVVDSDIFDRPTPRLVDGLELLLTLIHPELVKEQQ